jgi:hypothetical protein
MYDPFFPAPPLEGLAAAMNRFTFQPRIDPFELARQLGDDAFTRQTRNPALSAPVPVDSRRQRTHWYVPTGHHVTDKTRVLATRGYWLKRFEMIVF